MNNRSKINVSTQTGFSIVELMVAVFIGLVLVAGLIKVFDNTSDLNKTQNGLARIQENGRFSIMSMKQNIEQAGFQYCMSSGAESKDPDPASSVRGVLQRPWRVYTANPIFPGVPVDTANFFFDTANLIHGHECNSTSCSPSFASSGSDTSYTIPVIGTGQGDRIANTDVLTVRYIRGNGIEVDSITEIVGANAFDITPTAWSLTNAINNIDVGDIAIVASCNDSPVYAATVIENNTGVIRVSVPAGQEFSGDSFALSRLFSLDSDVVTTTYYVANNIVDGRNIPTLYSVINGTINAVIEGVDKFDVLYALDLGLTPPTTKYLTATDVQDLNVNECKPVPDGAEAIGFSNVTGCGWRGVNLIEIHLLLNSVHNSSRQSNEKYYYSLEGSNLITPASNMISNQNNEKLHRREFLAVIDLKNSQQ